MSRGGLPQPSRPVGCLALSSVSFTLFERSLKHAQPLGPKVQRGVLGPRAHSGSGSELVTRLECAELVDSRVNAKLGFLTQSLGWASDDRAPECNWMPPTKVTGGERVHEGYSGPKSLCEPGATDLPQGFGPQGIEESEDWKVGMSLGFAAEQRGEILT